MEGGSGALIVSHSTSRISISSGLELASVRPISASVAANVRRLGVAHHVGLHTADRASAGVLGLATRRVSEGGGVISAAILRADKVLPVARFSRTEL